MVCPHLSLLAAGQWLPFAAVGCSACGGNRILWCAEAGTVLQMIRLCWQPLTLARGMLLGLCYVQGQDCNTS